MPDVLNKTYSRRKPHLNVRYVSLYGSFQIHYITPSKTKVHKHGCIWQKSLNTETAKQDGEFDYASATAAAAC